MDKPTEDELMPLPGTAPLTMGDREFIIGRALLVIFAINVVWAVVIVMVVWAFR